MSDGPSFDDGVQPSPLPFTTLHDWLTMRPDTGDDASKVAASIREGRLGKLALTSRETRAALRVLLDDLDAYKGSLVEPMGPWVGRGQMSRLTQAIESGQITPNLLLELQQVLLVTVELLEILEELAEGQDGPVWAKLRTTGDSLRMFLSNDEV